MMSKHQRISYKKDLTRQTMLSKQGLDHLAQLERQVLDASREKAPIKVPTVQMSIRMEEEEYLRFRALCKALRRTNGDMLLHLMTSYLHQDATAQASTQSHSDPRPETST